MTYFVRQSKDWETAATLQAMTCPDDTPETPELGNVLWIARFGRAPVGFGMARPGRTKGTVFLSRAGVIEQHRGRGLQKRLIQARVRWAKDHGFKRAVTYVLPDNLLSLKNLLACGFDVYRPHRPWASHTVIYLRRMLG